MKIDLTNFRLYKYILYRNTIEFDMMELKRKKSLLFHLPTELNTHTHTKDTQTHTYTHSDTQANATYKTRWTHPS